MLSRVWLLWAATLLLTGCAIHIDGPRTGKLETETRSVDKSNAEFVNVDLNIGAGELRVSGGAAKLLDANFSYNTPAWKPEVRYDSTGFRGRLSVTQGRGSDLGGNIRNSWDLKFADDVPLDLNVRMGAGEGRLDLSTLSLRGVEVHLGAGEVQIDLRGQPKRSYDVNVRGGVGEATLRLPRDASIVATAGGGIGEVNVRGLRQDGNRWLSDNYGKSPVTIRVDVKGGIGQINIYAE